MSRPKKPRGIGGPCQYVANPNKPTFDPATHDKADAKIAALLSEPYAADLTAWEKEFLISVYGRGRLSKKQAMKVANIAKRVFA